MSFKSLLKVTATLILCLSCTQSFAAKTDDLITRLINEAGITRQMAELPDTIKMGFQQAAQQQENAIPKPKYDAIIGAIDSSYAPDQMLSLIHDALTKTITEKEALELLQWYGSDLGKKITLAEEQASSPQALGEMQQQAQQLLSDPTRVAYAQKLDQLTGTTKMAVAMQTDTSVAIYSGMNKALAPNKPIDPAGLEQFKTQMSAKLQQVMPRIQQMVTVGFVYAYRDIPMQDLNNYADFLSQPTAIKFTSATITGISDSIKAGTEVWATTVKAPKTL